MASITTRNPYHGKDETLEVEDYIVKHLDGADYDRGQIEAVSATADNAVRGLGKLLSLLVDKDILTTSDIKEIA